MGKNTVFLCLLGFILLSVVLAITVIPGEVENPGVQKYEEESQALGGKREVVEDVGTTIEIYREQFTMFEGEWKIVKYAGYGVESHSEEIYTQEYQSRLEKHIDTVTQEYEGKILSIDDTNITAFWPVSEGFYFESYLDLFHVIRQPATLEWEPPFWAFNIELKGDNEWKRIIKSGDNQYFLLVKGCFFELSRSE